MKTNKFFIGAFALLLAGLASCSDEEPIGEATVTPQAESEDGNQYLAVVISSPDDFGRAGTETEPTFEQGVGNECKFEARDMLFLFFDDRGNPFPLAATNVNGEEIVSNAVVPVDFTDEEGTTHGPGDEPLRRAVLVLGKPVGEGYVGTQPTQAICYINYVNRIAKEDVTNQTLEAVKAKTARLPNLDNQEIRFMMTNATYVDQYTSPEGQTVSKIVETVGLKGTNADGTTYDYFKPTKQDAENNPVTVYVERITAKVRLRGLQEYPTQERSAVTNELSDFTVDDKLTPLHVELVNWDLKKTAERNYLLKRISDKTINGGGFPGWNDPARHRCYWSEPLNYSTVNQSYDLYTAGTNASVDNVEYDPGTPQLNNEYCLEYTKTPDASVTDRNADATGIVVKGIVKMQVDTNGDGKIEGDEVNNWQPVTLIRWAGAYYTDLQFRKMVASAYNSRVTSTQDRATVDDVSYKTPAAGAKPNTWDVVVNVSGQDVTMPNFCGVLKWQDGITSYYMNVEHSIGSIPATGDQPEKKLIGVIRNHIYDYHVSAVVGLGIPGNDPTPPDETESFLAARVYCLNWRVVNNTVTLE